MDTLNRAALALLLVACGSTPPPAEPSPAPTPEVAAEPGPGALGFFLGQSPMEVREQHPELTFNADAVRPVATGNVTFRGRSWDVHLSFAEERLASISGYVTPSDLDEHEAVARELEAMLGEGTPQLCTNEGDPDLGAYLASGRGSVRREWEGDVRASVSLTPLSDERLQLRISVVDAPLMARQPMDDYLKGSKYRRPQPACGTLDLPQALGFSFGDTPAELQRSLGTQVDLTRHDARVPYRIAGVDGELLLNFYGETPQCLAVVMFLVEGGNTEYEALQSALLAELPQPERREICSPDGARPTDAQIAAETASRQTLWRGGPIEGSVRLSRLSERRPVLVTLELSASGLDDYAPQYDF